jgi:hypothetical protein
VTVRSVNAGTLRGYCVLLDKPLSPRVPAKTVISIMRIDGELVTGHSSSDELVKQLPAAWDVSPGSSNSSPRDQTDRCPPGELPNP